MTQRPKPPETLFDIENIGTFTPAPEIIDWARQTLINEGASLHNPEHAHLEHAIIGALWTNVPNSKNGRVILAQAEPGDPMAMGKWAKARARQQVEQWFGNIPDFILTFDAGYAATCSDIEFCALVDHELMHCAQATDEYGQPKFSRTTGLPIWAMRGHDIEEFTSIVRRYGAEAAHADAFIQAARQGPEIGEASIARACGVCLPRAA